MRELSPHACAVFSSQATFFHSYRPREESIEGLSRATHVARQVLPDDAAFCPTHYRTVHSGRPDRGARNPLRNRLNACHATWSADPDSVSPPLLEGDEAGKESATELMS